MELAFVLWNRKETIKPKGIDFFRIELHDVCDEESKYNAAMLTSVIRRHVGLS